FSGDFESFGEDNHYSATQIENNAVNTCLYPLLPACEELESEKFKEYSEINISRDQNDSFVEELLDERKEIIDGEPDINKITCEADIPDNSDHIMNENINYGSRFLAKDENGGNYRITQGMPRSIKFRSINNIYKCTLRLSPIEDEYNWNRPIEEDQI
ncbi:hypothetical protein EJD97_014420, partial [Solanum chilense]